VGCVSGCGLRLFSARVEVLAVAAEEAGHATANVDFGGGPVRGVWPARWIHGAPPGVRCQDPPLQAHRFDEHTFVLRQSKAVTYEAPFLYLLFGNDRALLLDTGAVADPRRMPLRAWASAARVTCRCRPVKERPSKWSRPRLVFSSR
jgi:hypothetical protein